MSRSITREEVRDLLKSAFGPCDVATMTGIYSRVTGTHCWQLREVPYDKLQAVWDETKRVIADRVEAAKKWQDAVDEPRTPAIAPTAARRPYTAEDVSDVLRRLTAECGHDVASRVLRSAGGCDYPGNVTPDKFAAVIELAQKVRDVEHPDDVLDDSALKRLAPASEVVAVHGTGDGIATPAQAASTKPTVDVLTAKVHEAPPQQDANALKALLVTISDVGLCMADLGTVAAQGLRPDNAARRGGIAIGLRRAAWRVEHGSLEGFDAEEDARKKHVDIAPFAALLHDILRHFDAQKFADSKSLMEDEAELIRRIDALLPKDKKPKNME